MLLFLIFFFFFLSVSETPRYNKQKQQIFFCVSEKNTKRPKTDASLCVVLGCV